MRSKFTVPGECIHYYTVEWDPALLSWADFREKLLGGTDPATAAKGSMRSVILRDYKKLRMTPSPSAPSRRSPRRNRPAGGLGSPAKAAAAAGKGAKTEERPELAPEWGRR